MSLEQIQRKLGIDSRSGDEAPALNTADCMPCLIVGVCLRVALSAWGPAQDYKEPLRPQFHFTPAATS